MHWKTQKRLLIASFSLILIILGGVLFGKITLGATEGTDYVWTTFAENSQIGGAAVTQIRAMTIYQNKLVVGTNNGSVYYHNPVSGSWASANLAAGRVVNDFKEFGGRLYTATENIGGAGEVWQTSDLNTWALAFSLAAANDYGYALETFSCGGIERLHFGGGGGLAKLFSCFSNCQNAGSWTDLSGGWGGIGFFSFGVFNDTLYMGGPQTSEYLRGNNVCDYTVAIGNFIDIGNILRAVNTFKIFGSNLYAGVNGDSGLIVSRADAAGTWTKIVGVGGTSGLGAGFNNVLNKYSHKLYSYQNALWLGVGKDAGTGTAETWRSNNGVNWEAYNQNGFGAAANYGAHSMVEYGKHLLASADNNSGAAIYRYDSKPSISALTATQTESSGGDSQIVFTTGDEENDRLTAKIEYKYKYGANNWQNVTAISSVSATNGTPSLNAAADPQISNITTSSANTLTVNWNTAQDIAGYNGSVRVRVTLSDGYLPASDIDNYDIDTSAPNAPALHPVTSPTSNATQTISGTKNSNTSVLLNNITIVSVNSSNKWSYKISPTAAYNLAEGTNHLNLTSKDSVGNESSTTTGKIILDRTKPVLKITPSGGIYQGDVTVTLKATDKAGNETGDTKPDIYYTIDGSSPVSKIGKMKPLDGSGTIKITKDTTLKAVAVDWVNLKSTTKTAKYVVEPPQVQIKKSAQLGNVGTAPIFSANVRDIFIPNPKKALANMSVLFGGIRDFFGFLFSFFNLPQGVLFKTAYYLFLILLGLVFFYAILVFDTELKRKKSTAKIIPVMAKSYGRFAYVLPTVLGIFIVFQLLFSLSLLALNPEVLPGQTLTYTITYKNIANSKTATEVYIKDAIPAEASYVANSLILNGVAKTDAKDNDASDFNGTYSNAVYFYLGNLAAKVEGYAQFKIKVNETATHNYSINNIATGAYKPGPVSFTSDPVSHTIKATGKISGYLFYDTNANKIREGGEAGIEGMEIQLYEDKNKNGKLENGDYLSAKVLSSADGEYEFSALSAGFYLVKPNLSENYQLTTSNVPGQVVLKTSLEHVKEVNFGYLILGVLPTTTVTPTTTISPTATITTTVTPTTTTSPTVTTSPITTPTPTPTSTEIIFPTETVTPTITTVEKPIISTIKNIFARIKKIGKNKIVQNSALPIITGLAALNLLTTAPISILGQLLRYLWQIFTEPFLYFGRNKRKGWGVVYDALTKEPIDLATIRLFERASGKLLETKVTDFSGRYIFIAELGRDYYMEVSKLGYVFPTKILVNLGQDSKYENLYHGEIISTGPISDIRRDEKGAINFNIPLDLKPGVVQNPYLPHKPIYTRIKTIEDFNKLSANAQKRENQKVALALTFRKINFIGGLIGPFISAIFFIIEPSLLTGLFLLAHFILMAFFLRMVIGKKVLPWGKTFEQKTREGLPQAVVRLFDKKYGRLLGVEVTKSGGRYGFLASGEKYVIIPNKPGYIFPRQKMEVAPSKNGLVKEDLGMERIKK